LQQNYYFPVAQEHLTMLDELGYNMDETSVENGKTGNDPPLSPSRQKQAPPEIITVEHSLSAISDFLKGIEPEDIPTQTQPEEATRKP
jgi:hypothetical protein